MYNPDIEKTHLTHGGKTAEDIYHYQFVGDDYIYVDKSSDPEYQKKDIDGELFDKKENGERGKFLGTREIKGDTASDKTNRFFIEVVTHAETFNKKLLEQFCEYFNPFSEYSISINGFYSKYGHLINPSNFGCNYKTQSDMTVFMPLRVENNEYVLSRKLPTLRVNSNKLKEHVFNKKDVYIPKNGIVRHDEGCINIGFAVPVEYMLGLDFCKEIIPINERLI